MSERASARRCRLCGHAGLHSPFQALEMMFGWRDAFTYEICSGCGSLQIRDVPDELGRFYPEAYASLAVDPPALFGGRLRATLRTARDRYAIWGHGVLGRLLDRVKPDLPLRSLRLVGLERSSRVLDVGCGRGLLLYALHRLGFAHLDGVDPFVPEDVTYGDSVRIRRASIHDLVQKRDREKDADPAYELIMFHHALEHTPDPVEQLRSAARLLAEDGTVLVRVPTCSSEAWERYREHWVQIDPPRHLVVPSRKGMARAAAAAGLAVRRVVDDSTAFQFWGSEQYRVDIPFFSPRSWAVSPEDAPFTRRQVRQWESEARALNVAGRGDQAIFLLERAREGAVDA